MKSYVTMLRVDPTKRIVTPIRVLIGKNAVPEVRRICRAKTVGHRELLNIDVAMSVPGIPGSAQMPITLVVAGGLEVDEQMKGWRLRGGEDTAGIGLLFGKGPTGGMIDSPVDAAWVRERVIWLEGEDVAGLEERAATILPSLPDDVRKVMARAMPGPDGAMWLPADCEPLFDACLALALTTPSTKGQRLSALGVKVHDMILEEAR